MNGRRRRRCKLVGILSVTLVLSLFLSAVSVTAADVRLTSMAVESCLASTYTKWRVTNDTGEDVSITWTVAYSGPSGSGTVGAEHTTAARFTNPYYIYVPKAHPATLILNYTWSSGSGSATKASGGAVNPSAPASIACPGPIVVPSDSGGSGAVVTWVLTVAGDPAPTVSCTPGSGSFFPIGTTTVTCTASNVCGTDTCSFTVTVLPPELVPAGLVGFLNRGWEDAAGGGGGLSEPPEVGELLVLTQYEIGEPISGCCAVLDGAGNPIDLPYVTMTWYAVTIGDDFFDVREPIDARLLYEEDGRFCFEIKTVDWAPGYYDIRLGAPFMDFVFIRVEVIAPVE